MGGLSAVSRKHGPEEWSQGQGPRVSVYQTIQVRETNDKTGDQRPVVAVSYQEDSKRSRESPRAWNMGVLLNAISKQK